MHKLARALVHRAVAAPLSRDGSRRRVGVIGGGWAGLAAAIEATRLGHAVTLFDMAPQLGGRSRGIGTAGLDNGQHILIGAYTATLALMRHIGVDLNLALIRTPLRISYPDGSGLKLRAGSPLLSFARAVLAQRSWPWPARVHLLTAATGWSLRGFRCDAALTVAALTAHLPRIVRDELVDPLCVAALNTPATHASATVFLRVLKDALFSGAGSADLLLPRICLSALFPEPGQHWLERAGASIRLSHRVQSLRRAEAGWQLDNENFDAVVLATPPQEAARLTRAIAPAWSTSAAALHFEPIVTVYLRSAAVRLPEPMLALRSDALHPAQFMFDRGQLGGPPGLLAFVISGAADWVEQGTAATLQATLAQAQSVLATLGYPPTLRLEPVQVVVEKRATFRCTPGLARPAMNIEAGLTAAGDHIDGPYPATLEGAVRSGLRAARTLR